MTDWDARMREAREANDPSRLLPHVPYAAFLGLSCEPSEGDALVVRMRFSEHLIGDSGIRALHGGTIGALLESAAIFTALWASDRLPRTINVTIAYLRSGRAKDTLASATITKSGRRVSNVRATAWQDDRDKPIATADVHFLLK